MVASERVTCLLNRLVTRSWCPGVPENLPKSLQWRPGKDVAGHCLGQEVNGWQLTPRSSGKAAGALTGRGHMSGCRCQLRAPLEEKPFVAPPSS